MSDLKIQTYSDKSFVIRGDTRPHRNSLKALGGKWNANLTDKETGESFKGWIFWQAKREELAKWVKDGCPEIKNQKVSIHDRTYEKMEERLSNMVSKIIFGEKMSKIIKDCIKTQVDNILKAEAPPASEPPSRNQQKRLLKCKSDM